MLRSSNLCCFKLHEQNIARLAFLGPKGSDGNERGWKIMEKSAPTTLYIMHVWYIYIYTDIYIYNHILKPTSISKFHLTPSNKEHWGCVRPAYSCATTYVSTLLGLWVCMMSEVAVARRQRMQGWHFGGHVWRLCKQQISHQNWPLNSWNMLASTEPHRMRPWLLWEWLQNSTLSMVEALWLVYPGKLQTPSKESHHQKVFLELTKGLFTGAETKTGSSDTAKFCS